MSISFVGRVAIVTGAGGGLGREHALALGQRGAKVVVNDLGPGAEAVANEIKAAGGEAIASIGSVTDFAAVQATVKLAMDTWGRVDILVNNAGILRDKSFSKMELDDFKLVVDVHLMGAVNCCKAVWDIMRAQKYGRIVNTTSSSGLFGNFGQANYGAAKMALVGLMQTLSIEGTKDNVRVNCLAPTAATAMTEGLMPQAVLDKLAPAAVTPGLLYLVSEDAPSRVILNAGAGTFARSYITMTHGVHIGTPADADDQVAARFEDISDRGEEVVPQSGSEQGRNEVGQAMAAG
ncbi:MAG: SDR family NAD(P)-dependent oxidoreductase [Rhizobacter sp.]|nr:SDR family NAD(P)-dependent oxidoreductase [Rhizobacter sp.]